MKFILVLAFFFAAWMLLIFLSKKRKAKPLWNPADEEDLKNHLRQIYSTLTLENLNKLFTKAIRFYPKYHDLFRVAAEEKRQEFTQDSLNSSFEANERKVRKFWILSLYINYFILWLFTVTSTLVDFEGESSEVKLMVILVSILLIGSIIGVIYHCAYKKKGTVLLTWIVFTSPLQILNFFAKEGIDLSLWYFTALDLAIFGFYWYNSFRLRKINYEVLAKKQLFHLKQIT